MFTPITRSESTTAPARPRKRHALRAAVSGSLALVLVAASTPAVRADHKDDDDKWCGPRIFFKRKYLSPRNFFVPRTRFIDGPGGSMKVRVEREHEVKAYLLTENEKQKIVRDERGTQTTTEKGTQTTAEKGTETTTERGAETTAEKGKEITKERTVEIPADMATETERATKTTAESETAAAAESETDSASKSETDSANKSETGFTTKEVVRVLRRMGLPQLEQRHKVFVGHEYTQEISKGMYGNMWYRVFGYRIGWSAWSVLRTCRHVEITSGIANVPARVEGWRYWETRHPMFKGRRLSLK
ncbi:hypothetical protein [Nonomuraea sp. NPDC049480]|uniref:hypothetical protein n=1 Tax=Nonomuraea sp. NPDC049480 TaxID=3364353 RepID=UPI00379DE799